MGLDRDGQPNSNFNATKRAARSTDELIGLCKGIIADGRVCECEAKFLLDWFQRNHADLNEWPARVILERVNRAFLDDFRFDETELKEIHDVIKSTIGTRAPSAETPATDLPLSPVENLEIWGKSFCFTGKFIYGNRKDCERAVEEQGGIPRGNVAMDLDYLVVGSIGSRDWKHSSFGTKILKAVELREIGLPLSIVSEEFWAKYL